MRRPVIIAVAAGAVFAGAASFAVPAFATTPAPTNATCPVTGQPVGARSGEGRGMGPAGRGVGAGTGAGMRMGQRNHDAADMVAGVAKGTLTESQKRSLAGMAEEEKLAHDVYVALAATTDDARFARISTAETRHLTEVRALLTRYGVTDPTAGKAAGTFTSSGVQRQYSEFVARGWASPDAALAVGRDIEAADIADLAKARTGVTAPDVLAVYDHLTRGSRMHLRAFGG